jgi:hypothetical protein
MCMNNVFWVVFFMCHIFWRGSTNSTTKSRGIQETEVRSRVRGPSSQNSKLLLNGNRPPSDHDTTAPLGLWENPIYRTRPQTLTF